MATTTTHIKCSDYKMLEVDDALVILLSQVHPLASQLVPLMDCLGRIVSEEIKAKDPFPAFPTSMMDGYAIRAPLPKGKYQLQDRIHAGSAVVELQEDKVVYITTGAPIPPGANAVIKVEDTESASENGLTVIALNSEISVGENIRQIGSDIAEGESLVLPGDEIGPAEIGLFATVGVMEVKCYQQPVIGVMSTGDELVNPWETPTGSQIRDSNRATLINAFKQDGYFAKDFGIVKDVRLTLKQTILTASEVCDVLVTSGGVSMGDADYVKGILSEIGTIHFGRINMKPGKPSTFATIPKSNGGICYFFGLPGNPVSCLVTKGLLVDPALKRLQGSSSKNCMHTELNIQVSKNIKLDPERPEYHRASVAFDQSSNKFIATSTGLQRSSRLMSMKSANVLLCLPKGVFSVNSGDMVKGLLLGNLPSPQEKDCFHRKASSLDFPPVTEEVKQSTVKKQGISFDNKGNPIIQNQKVRVGLITISDRASQGVYSDESGPEMNKLLTHMSQEEHYPLEFDIVKSSLVPDEREEISKTIVAWTARESSDRVDLILTSGGTGFGPRDITPETILPLLHRQAPAVAQALINEGLKFTPLAVLSRPVVGTRFDTLIVTLPGSVKAVRENITALKPLLPRILNLITSGQCSHNS